MLNLLFGQINFDVLRVAIYGDQRIWGNQHLSADKPVAGVGDEIADCPMPVIEVKFFDLPNFSIKAVKFVTLYCFKIAQHNSFFGLNFFVAVAKESELKKINFTGLGTVALP